MMKLEGDELEWKLQALRLGTYHLGEIWGFRISSLVEEEGTRSES